MSIINDIKARFSKRPYKHMDMPEWSEAGQPPMRIYYRTPNAATFAEIMRKAGDDAFAAAAHTVALCAATETGERLFNDGDWHSLYTESDSIALGRLSAAIQTGARIDGDSGLKN
jgi:hypothetical protein